MRADLMLVGLVIAFFAYISNYQSAGFIIALVAVFAGLLPERQAAKPSGKASGQIMEPIVYETTWGSSVKQMPKEMTIFTAEYGERHGAGAKRTSKGIPGAVARWVGRQLK